MPPSGPGSTSQAGTANQGRNIKSEDVDPKLPLAITIAGVDSHTPLRHLPPVVSNDSNIRPVQLRPIPVRNNRVLLTKDQWKAGAPWPRGSKRAFFKVSRRFRRPRASKLPNLGHHLQQHHAKRYSRLRGVTFLSPGDLESAWVAGLVGFDNTHQLNTWLDRDVARVVYDFFRLLDGQTLPPLPAIVSTIAFMRASHDPLCAELDANPGVVIGESGVVSVQELDAITHHGGDATWSYIAVLYRILASFPQRFPEEEDQSHKIWGFTHNNWQAALCVFRAFKKRRGSSMKSDTSPSERINLNAVWYGTIAEQRSLAFAGIHSSAAEARNAVSDTSVAKSHQGHGNGGFAGVKVEDGDEGSNGGGVSGGFKIAMVGSVVIDPQEAPAASPAAQGSGSGFWSWLRGN